MCNILNTLTFLRAQAKLILTILLKNGPVSKSFLLNLTGMKLTTLNRIMGPLEESKFVIKSSIGESTGGRKPVLYEINPKNFYLVGIDISRTYTRMVITNLKMDILFEHQFTMLESSTPKKVIESLCIFINNSCEKLCIKKHDILGIGIGTVGPLDRTKGIIINPANFSAPDWKNVDIKEMAETGTGLPAVIDNGANSAVLAEKHFGQGKLFENIAYFNCGMGIRTSAFSSGTIVRTINDCEDAFGHMVVDIDGELCSCGNKGCIESYSSLISIVKKYIEGIKIGGISSISIPLDYVGFTDICVAAEEGDELAKEVITKAAEAFGIGLANYINLLNPHLVILSGPLIKTSTLFFETSISIAMSKAYHKNICFSRGGFFKDKAIAVGAAVSILDQVLNMHNSIGGYLND